MNDRPIGLFDSGVGGLFVFREIAKLLPHEDLIYLADQSNLPYGEKSPETMIQIARENGQFLIEKGIKLLVIPCNTACVHALSILQNTLSIPIIGILDSAIALLKKNSFSHLALLGTKSTIESHIYQTTIAQFSNARIESVSCPEFVTMAEQGDCNNQIIEQYLTPFRPQINLALIACTHFSFLLPSLQQILKPIPIMDPAEQCALDVKNALIDQNLLNSKKLPGLYTFYTSGDPISFQDKVNVFIGKQIGAVKKKSKNL